MKTTSKHWLLISGGTTLVVPKTNGTRKLRSKPILGRISSLDLRKKCDLSQFDLPSQQKEVEVYELVRRLDAEPSWEEALKSLNPKIEQLCFTQHQMCEFITRYPIWYGVDVAFAFLMQTEGQYTVVIFGESYNDFSKTFFEKELSDFAGWTHSVRLIVPKQLGYVNLNTAGRAVIDEPYKLSVPSKTSQITKGDGEFNMGE